MSVSTSPVTPPYEDEYCHENPKPLPEAGLRITPPSDCLHVPTMTFSPPPTPRSPQPNKMSLRLRSNSGLTLHTNEEAFRRYTDYNPDGSPRSPTFGPGIWSSLGSVSTTLRRNFGPSVTETEPTETLPIVDLLGRDVCQMVLGNTQTSQRLFNFAHERGCGSDIEFLLRVQEYMRSLSQFGKQASSMPTPCNLPSPVTKSLNADMKQLTGVVLPGLDALFTESKRCVEHRVAKSIYPAFVKYQLALFTSASFAGSRKPKEPGLAESFCLTDALSPDNPMVAASDAFVSVSGYSRQDAFSRNCRFLQGNLTSQDATQRIKDAVLREEESLELILNYRRDGTPFWNLLYTCPLLDASGKLRYYLGGQINVSENICDSKDLLRILNFGPALDELPKDDASGRESRISRRLSQTSTRDRKRERRTSLRSRNSLHNKGPKTSLFQPFRKYATAHGNDYSDDLDNRENGENMPPSQGVGLGLEQMKPTSDLEEKLPFDTEVPAVYSAYSRCIVLQNTDGPFGFPPRSSSLPSDTSKRKAPRLSVAYCSAAALNALGLGLFAENVTHRDIFMVLSELAGSTSITKSFKNTVRERVLRNGKTATLDIMLGGGYLARKGSLIGLGGGRSSKDDSYGSKRKPGRPVSRSGLASLVGEGSKMEKLTSYWTPLKNAEEKVEWVVLIIAPMK